MGPACRGRRRRWQQQRGQPLPPPPTLQQRLSRYGHNSSLRRSQAPPPLSEATRSLHSLPLSWHRMVGACPPIRINALPHATVSPIRIHTLFPDSPNLSRCTRRPPLWDEWRRAMSSIWGRWSLRHRRTVLHPALPREWREESCTHLHVRHACWLHVPRGPP